MRRILSAVGAVLASAALVTGLAACSADPLADQYRAGDNKGYIAANGFQTKEIAADQRGEPVEFSGTLDNGSPVSSADFSGKVLVVNFWYATCGPCIIEAPRLEQAYQSFQDRTSPSSASTPTTSPRPPCRSRATTRCRTPARWRSTTPS